MFARTLHTLVVALILVGSASKAQEAPTDQAPTVEESFANIVALGPGVHRIKTDPDGRVQSCIVVAQSPVSTVLGPARGLQIARSRAELAAAAEFVKWLKRSTEVRETSETETVVVLEGTDKGGQASRHETGKRLEKDTAQYTVAARGLVRGLQVLHVDIDAEEGTYTLVMGWSADGAAAARQAENGESAMTMAPPPRTSAAPTTGERAIRSRRATAADARRFLD